jgi:restriction system protein
VVLNVAAADRTRPDVLPLTSRPVTLKCDGPKLDDSPFLSLATNQDITRRHAGDVMADHVSLTDKERQARIPSGGSTYINHRTGWAMTFLTKAKLIEKVEKATYRATQSGHAFLKAHPPESLVADLKQIPGWEEAWEQGRRRRAEARERRNLTTEHQDSESSSMTPLELLGQSSEALDQALKVDLLDRLSEIDPYRFEHIVVDLLFAMGYGGSREEAAQVTKASNDEGVDGVLNQDRLGLDVIYVQAKRWQNNVGRKEIQSVVGALAGKQANKGVFITTSKFAKTAEDYAKSVSQRVILVDGNRLGELMIEHDIGVTTAQTVSVKRIDSDHFEDE